MAGNLAAARGWGQAMLGAALLAAGGAPGQARGAEEAPVTREEFERLEKELAELRAQGVPVAPPVDPHAPPAGSLPSSGKGGVYDKPFLDRMTPRAHLGGYFDLEFIDAENQRHEFRFHRLVPFIYADIHERLKFATEIEIEDGHEVEVEFAFLDVILARQASVRGGVILDPLGKFNLIHDSPINDLTDRPLVDQLVIPTTLREPGAGLFGTLTPEDSAWEVKYEAYVTSGFKGLSDDPADAPAITTDDGLRDARAHEEVLGTRSFGDNNNSFAGVGRVSVSPLLGTEVGASAYHGAYDEDGDNDLTIVAIDGLYTLRQLRAGDVPIGPIELQGEGAYAFIERNGFARAEGVPGDLWGYYLQLNYHFLPEYFLPQGTRWTTALFPESTFTLVGRWDHVDLDGSELHRWTIGLNFRPIEATVFKIDYQLNRGTGSSPDTADDDAFLISLASYF